MRDAATTLRTPYATAWCLPAFNVSVSRLRQPGHVPPFAHAATIKTPHLDLPLAADTQPATLGPEEILNPGKRRTDRDISTGSPWLWAALALVGHDAGAAMENDSQFPTARS